METRSDLRTRRTRPNFSVSDKFSFAFFLCDVLFCLLLFILRYGASTTPLLWNKLASEGSSSVQCPPPGGEGPPFHIAVSYVRTTSVLKVICEKKLLYFRNSKCKFLGLRNLCVNKTI